MTRLRIEAEVTGGGCFFHGSNAQKSQKQHAIYTYCKYAFRNAMIWRYMKKYVANGVIRKPQLVFFFLAQGPRLEDLQQETCANKFGGPDSMHHTVDGRNPSLLLGMFFNTM